MGRTSLQRKLHTTLTDKTKEKLKYAWFWTLSQLRFVIWAIFIAILIKLNSITKP